MGEPDPSPLTAAVGSGDCPVRLSAPNSAISAHLEGNNGWRPDPLGIHRWRDLRIPTAAAGQTDSKTRRVKCSIFVDGTSVGVVAANGNVYEIAPGEINQCDFEFEQQDTAVTVPPTFWLRANHARNGLSMTDGSGSQITHASFASE